MSCETLDLSGAAQLVKDDIEKIIYIEYNAMKLLTRDAFCKRKMSL